MYVAADGLVVSPTDLTKHLECVHLTRLDLAVARGRLAKPQVQDDVREVQLARGLEHERTYLERLRASGLRIAEIDCDDLRLAERETVAAMRAGVDVVYQATFFDGVWRGHADFLEKRPDRPSALGSWSYDVADTKLARRLKVAALLQMATYAERLTDLQGVPPELLTVVTGDGQRRSFRLADCAAYARRARAELLRAVHDSSVVTYPEKVRYCPSCTWNEHCTAQRRADDHLSFVAGMRRDHARLLAEVGVGTLAALAATEPGALPPSIGAPARERLTGQARLQARERLSGTPVYQLLPAEPHRGFALLPEPSHGDLFFDMEGDPYAGEGGLEYLFGVSDAADGFTAYWAHSAAEEKRAFEALVDQLIAGWAADPAMHVFHYAAYEQTALKKLSARHNTRIDEIDRLLRGRRLVDLYAVVRQGLRVSRESYSIKQLEAFYDPAARAGSEVADGVSSILAYERWLASGEGAELEAIERYNEVDCRSTRRLRDWLERCRAELLATGAVVERPAFADDRPSESAVATNEATQRLHAELTAGLPAERAARDDPQQATWLLAAVLDWHRREARPEWWDYFHRLELTDEQLVDDPAAVGQLGPPAEVRTEKRSTVWRYEFPPQDTKLKAGDKRYVDPRTEKPAGTVAAIDAEQGWLELRRVSTNGPPTPPSLVPGTPIDDRSHRAALARLAEWVRDHGVDAPGPYRAARDLLLRRPPRIASVDRLAGNGGRPETVGVPSAGRLEPTGEPAERLVRDGESPADAVSRLALGLRGGALAVQGPPGSGKTWAAARTVVRLVRQGQRVGICAFSHKAIGNLLEEVMRAADQAGLPLQALQKADADDRCPADGVRHTTNNEDIVTAIQQGQVDVVAGTSWLFARADMAGGVDTLVIDEAGQMALANVLSLAGAARNLVLFGDPQQLSQPAKGDHPAGAGVSALEHLLGEATTIPAELGVFLDRTWRMHPAVARFVSDVIYDGRLRSHPSCAVQRIDAPGDLPAAGTRFVPVEHTGDSVASTAEAREVRRLFDTLLHGNWTDSQGMSRRLTVDDVLVVAPYNAHVARLRARLPAGARVGTVDKFQGQEAPVVIYSTATSSAADAPRGLDFLFSRNRLNVAVSRARVLAVIVASPALLDSPVRTPEQLALVNALCRFAELSEAVAAPVPG